MLLYLNMPYLPTGWRLTIPSMSARMRFTRWAYWRSTAAESASTPARVAR